jgi:uncharacterized coiled-coil DUF342 family protein
LKRWSDERNALNSMIREKWKEICLLKTKRDETNQAVKQLKEDTTLILTQLDTQKSRYIALTKRSNTISYTTLQNDIELHEQKIKDLDWKIQTTPLSRVNEEQIISQIRYLEEQLLLNRKAITLKKEKDELFSIIKKLSVRSNTIHHQKLDYVKKGQDYHTKMLKMINEVNKVKIKADLAHNTCIKFTNEVNTIYNQYLGITNQIRNITLTIRKIEEKTKQKDLELMIEEQSKKAHEKMKQRKKLTLNEYRLLRKKGLA